MLLSDLVVNPFLKACIVDILLEPLAFAGRYVEVLVVFLKAFASFFLEADSTGDLFVDYHVLQIIWML